ncbi:MAG: endonuclease/exonuclease/phosphatase family protein [Alistipes sp.]|nr:endonuclease/exonuclease/phosphatase family protein [Candidatus Alistipes equi]
MNKTQSFFLVAVILAILSCRTSHSENQYVPKVKADTIRILHYNVGAFQKSEQTSINYVAAMAKETGAQFISMNELDSCTQRTKKVFQAKEFARAMGKWNYFFGRAMPYDGGAYGIAIATSPSRPINKAYVVSLEKGDGSEPRALCVAECGDIVFATTHLDHKGPTSQLLQAKKVSSTLLSKYKGQGKTVILCGDMNALPSSETIKTFEKDWTILNDTLQYTYSAKKPSRCIDYVMLMKESAPFSILKSQVRTSFVSGDIEVASDHLPLETVIFISRQLKN